MPSPPHPLFTRPGQRARARWVRIISAVVVWVGLAGCSPVKARHSLMSARWEMKGFRSETMSFGTSQVHHWVGGQGPTVVLIHGFGSDGLTTWWSQAQALADDHTVIVPDLLWFGQSSSSATPTLDAQVEAIRALIEHHVPEGEAVDVVGISYGGFVALRYGAAVPDRQGRLVILDSPVRSFTPADSRALLERFGVSAIEDIFVPRDTQAVKVLLELAFHRPPPLPEPVLRDIQRQVFSQHLEEKTALLHDLEARRDLYQSTPPADYEAVMVIWGDHDRVFPLEKGHLVAADLKAELVVIADTAHAPHMEEPALVNAALERFLQR